MRSVVAILEIHREQLKDLLAKNKVVELQRNRHGDDGMCYRVWVRAQVSSPVRFVAVSETFPERWCVSKLWSGTIPIVLAVCLQYLVSKELIPSLSCSCAQFEDFRGQNFAGLFRCVSNWASKPFRCGELYNAHASLIRNTIARTHTLACCIANILVVSRMGIGTFL